MKKKIFLILILFLMCKSNVLGLSYGGCDYAVVSRLKSLVSNINLSYSYRIVNNKAYYDVTLTNIPKDVYFIDVLTSKYYYYSNTNNGEITIRDYDGKSGRYKFYSYTNNCTNVLLGNKYYNFPIYNIYYNDPLCKDIPNYSLCKKWVDKLYPSYEFERRINEYKFNLNNNEIIEEEVIYEKTLFNKIIDFYVKYYYLILGAIILVCWIIIMISRKKNSFKL